MQIIRAKQIKKFFHNPNKFQVLQGIDLAINEGEMVGIVGKSGCGKSTLLYILSTLDTDYEGSLSIKGEHVTEKSTDYLANFRNKNIGFVFQSNFLISELNVVENVILPLMKKGNVSWKEAESQGMEILSKVGLSEQYKKDIRQLSGGQQQRVAVARALINNPAIVIADEPTGNLDQKNTNNVIELFQKISTDFNKTIIVVTHDNNFANSCGRIIKMLDGCIIE
jgi:lipoprotein-releasing system ATP-binding protein